MDLGLSGRTAIVGAASKGLGRAVATALAEEGVNIVMFSRSRENIEAAADGVRDAVAAASSQAQVLPLVGDVTDLSTLDAVIAEANARYGGVDILYNNAEPPKVAGFDQATDDDWDRTVRGSLMSAVRMTRGVLPHMRAQRWGRILNGTSFSVKQPAPNLILSNAIRSATTAWSKSLSDEVARDGITVNAIAPGYFDTDRVAAYERGVQERTGRTIEVIRAERLATVPVGRYGRPEEFARAVAFLASEQAAYITGVTLLVDGGLVRATY